MNSISPLAIGTHIGPGQVWSLTADVRTQRQRMGLQPQRTGCDRGVDAEMAPPGRFIAAAVHFAMMAAAQRHGKLVADPAPERARLHEAQVVGIRRAAAADQARQFGQRSDVIAIAQAPRLRQRQPALVDHRGARPGRRRR